jgi:hypothetical protein
MNTATFVPFPQIKDDEMQTITVVHTKLPGFASFADLQYSFNPTIEIGVFVVEGYMTDGKD